MSLSKKEDFQKYSEFFSLLDLALIISETYRLNSLKFVSG